MVIERIAVVLVLLLALSACLVTPITEEPASDNAAVLALLESADAADTAGNYEAAAAATERALRIEPRNARLWHRLARVHLRQNQADNAAALAIKSNALAGDDTRLRAANWQLIGEARLSQGNREAAEAAFTRAEEFERRTR